MKIPKHAKKVFSGVIFEVYQWEETNFDGSKAIWEGLKRAPGVQLFVKTKEGKWLLQDEERPGNKRYLLMPGGFMEENETPLEAAKRELLEEAGMTGEFKHLDSIDLSFPRTEWISHFFLVTDAVKIQEPAFDPGERIIPVLLEKEEYLKKIQEKKFLNKHAKNYIQALD
ncbi:MAG: NUDIX hydrolase [Nanoarchaeota archaeon]|nr:NUDIX hydrolase [Nanoarchaeota archaeon]